MKTIKKVFKDEEEYINDKLNHIQGRMLTHNQINLIKTSQKLTV